MDLLQSQMSGLRAHHGVAQISLQPSARPQEPQTSCDRALGCGEVLYEILQCVSRVGEHSKRNLLNTALANKFFVDPSLDLLWSTMHSLGPFLLLLPCHDTTTGSAQKILMIGSPATESGLFMKYANRLRFLELGERCQKSDVFSMLSIERLARLQAKTPIFPRLERISFTSPEVSQLQAAYTELTALSTITKLEFNGLHIETTSFVHILSLFLFNPLTLRDLTLNLPEPGRYFDMGSLHYLQYLTSLCNLSISCLNIDFPLFGLMQWISELKFLRTLKLDTRIDDDAPDSVGRLRSKASSLSLLRLAGPFPFIRSTIHVFQDVAERIELDFNDVGSDEEGNGIEVFIRSLNHPHLSVVFSEPE